LFALMTQKAPLADRAQVDVLDELVRGQLPALPAGSDSYVQHWYGLMTKRDAKRRPDAAEVSATFMAELVRRGVVDRRARLRMFLGTEHDSTRIFDVAQSSRVRVPVLATTQRSMAGQAPGETFVGSTAMATTENRITAPQAQQRAPNRAVVLLTLALAV